MDHPKLFDHQNEFLDGIVSQPEPVRACIYFRTGAGKSMTAMLGMRTLGHSTVLVIAPPATHLQWELLARQLGMQAVTMSHAKFRMKGTKLSKTIPIIADESHLFGGHGGMGWKKLDTIAMYLKAPLFLLSATPQYNDAERVYCIVHITDPNAHKGGYLSFLYANCITKQNPFSTTPDVEGFKNHADATEYLSSQPNVYYLEDNAQYQITDIPYLAPMPPGFDEYNYDPRRHRIMASQIEKRHAVVAHALLTDSGVLRDEVMTELRALVGAGGKTLVFAAHSTVAWGLGRSLAPLGDRVSILTGSTLKPEKERLIERFRSGGCEILVGTATLATGTDGLDKVCDRLVIVDDTDDDALRRQLVGRILPRGDAAPSTTKEIFRLVPLL